MEMVLKQPEGSERNQNKEQLIVDVQAETRQGLTRKSRGGLAAS